MRAGGLSGQVLYAIRNAMSRHFHRGAHPGPRRDQARDLVLRPAQHVRGQIADDQDPQGVLNHGERSSSNT